MAKIGTPTTLEDADARTGKIRVADTLMDSDSDGQVPVHRIRARSREDSGAIARAVLDKANDVSLRKLGLGVPDEIRGIIADELTDGLENVMASIRDEFFRSKRSETSAQGQPGAGQGLQRWAFVVSIVTAIALITSIVIGSLAIMKMTDRLLNANTEHRADMDKLSLRIIDSEARQLKLETNHESSEKTLTNHERRITQSEARQDALVIYLLEGVDSLLKERRIKPPDVPPILQIAKAEIMLKYSGDK